MTYPRLNAEGGRTTFYRNDHAEANLVFWVAGFVCLASVPTVLVTGKQGRRSGQAAAADSDGPQRAGVAR